MNIGSLLTRHARYWPDRLALVFADKRLSFGQLDDGVNRLANALLAAGVAKGDKVATILPNRIELLQLYWAAAKTGAVVVPLSPLLQPKGIAGLLRASDTVRIFADAEFADALEYIRPELSRVAPDAYVLTGNYGGDRFTRFEDFIAAAPNCEPPDAQVNDEDPFNIIYSSGTTGDPKGIVHTHYVRCIYAMTFASNWRITPESVVLHAGSIVFNGAFVTLMPALFTGCTYVLMKAFEPRAFIETIVRERATHVMLVPSQIVALLNSPNFTVDKVGSLEMLMSLGAPLHMQHKQRINELLPGRFYELYGLTEGFWSILDRSDYERKPQSVGVPPPLFEMRIADEENRDVPAGEVGEIVGRGPAMMPGYYKRPDLTAGTIIDGWLHTGDMGYVDEDGFLYLVDRQKDMIISGGVNVFPRDIEEVAVMHPAVREVAVFGAPDEKWGETPVAAIILSDPDAATAGELKDWINANVEAKFQRVSRVVIMNDFPRNVAGKTLKRVLRDEHVQT